MFVSVLRPGEKIGLKRGAEFVLRIVLPVRGQEEVSRQDNTFGQAPFEVQEFKPRGVAGEIETCDVVQCVRQRGCAGRECAGQEHKDKEKRACGETPQARFRWMH